ncbi:MAG: deoxyribodipyrimidine photolyase, partial [Candidatus Bipolaricaulota bacterium]
EVGEAIDVELVQVEGNVVVPVETASKEEEYAARTIRPKINEKLDEFLEVHQIPEPKEPSLDLDTPLETSDPEVLLDELEIDRSVKPVSRFSGGTSEAEELLEDFIEDKLEEYPDKSSDPGEDYLSHMSPYLHFGQISPVYIANRVREAGGPGVEDYLEQLIVRRELSINFVHYNQNYDDFGSILPDWAFESLMEHKDDERKYLYTLEEFENAETHDPYWNAAQKEMNLTGKTHGYMRMYWGKKILEWTPNPERGYEITLYLNNKYELDGRDPNGFTGVAWCYGKHDQGWKERPVFGKTRYMNANGLERKFDIQSYVDKISNIEEDLVGNN